MTENVLAGSWRVEVVVSVPLAQSFTYVIDAAWQSTLPAGVRVWVPFGRRRLLGVVVSAPFWSENHDFDYKTVEAVLDATPVFDAASLALVQWASQYYHHPLGEVLHTALPPFLAAGKTPKTPKNPPKIPKKPKNPASLLPLPALTPAQQQAAAALPALGAFKTVLLDGVTGSGKTELYLAHAQAALAAGLQVLVLCPEIGLTPQLAARFIQHFGEQTHVYHSGLAASVRAQSWLKALSGEAGVWIGTRSAVWLPLSRLGAVMVDEEHDAGYRQQDNFRYSARDIAVWRGKQAEAPVILGSATPSLESLAHAEAQRYGWLKLDVRVHDQAPPTLQLLDIRKKISSSALSPTLLERAQPHLDAGGQCLFFLNRRGYAPVWMCDDCGFVAPCHQCDANMTYHHQRKKLVCHHCGSERPSPPACPSCGSKVFTALGAGTERLEQALREAFPQQRVERLDSDRRFAKGGLESLLADIQQGQVPILTGTQMLAKGHNFPQLSFVGIVDTDQALYSEDFRALERMAQLITQVAGRAGRDGRPAEVFLQTAHPEHPNLRVLVKQGYRALAQSLLKERQQQGLPPFSYQAHWRAESRTAGAALRWLQGQSGALDQTIAEHNLEVFGPIADVMERRAGYYRAHVLLQSRQRSALHAALARLRALAAPSGVRVWLEVGG
jgi:primosomal protein N' (replication factor Y)